MFKKLREKFSSYLSQDIAIDLGTANTLVYIRDRGVVVNEPSVIAINQKTGRVVAVGSEAKQMLGRTPPHIVAVKPLVDGVISDFELAEEMITFLVNKSQKGSKNLIGPRVVVGVPSGITNVEIRAVRDATLNAGAKEVFIIEEPMAAAIGMKLPVMEPVGSMVIDIGGGTSDIAVISLGGVVRSKSLRIAGNKLNSDVTSYIRSEFKILIGEKTAEDIKLAIGRVIPGDDVLEATIKGRDLVSGLPREVIITDADIREAISSSIAIFIESIKEVMETTPPEILADIMHRGLHLAGGGALLRGLPQLIAQQIKVPVFIAEDPLTVVARGAGIVLENMDKFFEVLIADDDELPPQN